MTKRHPRTPHPRALLWIAAAALLAISPLLFSGASCGHDLNFHLLNWMEIASQWKHGIVRPFWCSHAAWNAGEPRFVFYPPLSWTLGAALSLAVPVAALPAAYVLIALLLCGLSMHRCLRDLTSSHVALLVSCIYLANPYALFTAFERSAFAELLAAAWMPLLLRAALSDRIGIVRLAIPVALLWLTNAPAAVAGSYALLVVSAVRCVQIGQRERWTRLMGFVGRIVSGYALGLACSAFFLLPAIVQRPLVQIQMAVISGMRPADNFLFTHSGQPDHDLVLQQASLIAAGVLSVGLVCFAWLMLRRNHHVTWRSMHDCQMSSHTEARSPAKAITTPLGLLLLVILFLLTPLSAFVWRHAPELPFLQFPWRFLAVGAAATAVLVALLLPRQRSRSFSITAGLLLALLSGWWAHRLYAQPCDDEDAPAHQEALFQDNAGAEPTDEYTPIAADNDSLKSRLPEAWTVDAEDDGPSPGSKVPGIASDPSGSYHFILSSTHAAYLVVRLRQFYGWHVQMDGAMASIHSQRNDGLLAIPLAPGPHRVTVLYRWTWDELLGLLISGTAIAAILAFGARSKRLMLRTQWRDRKNRRAIP